MDNTDNWNVIPVPENRPQGHWVNWKYRTGWFSVKGTPNYMRFVNLLARVLALPNGFGHEWRIELRREPDNKFDSSAIQVFAIVKLPNEEWTTMLLGYVEKPAAHWLADNFAPEMPIGGSLVRFTTKEEAAAIKICGLMPPKGQRAEFEL